ncbi:hypothetical protein JKF63_03545 [Porcisia hertigi]|uniref:J domain-containing protein n=1 Tax=Porcisia hertigi TaxID=2761500 RepID=A0A836L855_9TRYP|nr:hypothetical protein JKF63_03545 [Porcisia hertigi]
MQSKANAPPHYECLGVDPSIDAADLARHYKKLSLQLHPDRAAYRNDPANEAHVQARYQCITEAYAVLSDPEKRSAYDAAHGVNFRSRLVRLQGVIDGHKAMEQQRTATGRDAGGSSCVSSPTVLQPGTQHQHAAPQRDPAEDSDDDDEEYDPNEFAAPFCGERHLDGLHGTHIDSSSDVHEGDDCMARLFSLKLRLGVEAAPRTCHGVPVTQYQEVVLTRALGSKAPPYARTWGLIFDKNELVGLDGDDPEGLESIGGMAAIPFPSVVQRINDTMVHSTTDVPRLLSRLYDAEPARGATVGATTVPAASPDGAHTCKSEDLCEARAEASTASPAPSTEQLRLLLAYSTVAYDLVGEVHLLQDNDVLARLVPSWCVVPQLRPLIRDATVRCVNEKQVRSVTELRAALRVALRDEEGEGAVQVVKRARTSRSVAVQFCQLPFL